MKSNGPVNARLFTFRFCLWVVLALHVSCSKKTTQTTTLHNYPMFDGMDCPDVTRNGYDMKIIKMRASAVDMRPVDYLHWANKQKWKPIKVEHKNYVGFGNN